MEHAKKRLPGWAWALIIPGGAVTTLLLFGLLYSLIVLLLPVHKDFRSTTVAAEAAFTEAVHREDPEALAALLPLDLGNTESQTAYSYERTDAISATYCYVLLCGYPAEDYPMAKEAVEKRYAFRTKPLETGKVEDGKALTISPYERLGDDEFRFVLPADEPSDPTITYCFYHRSVMIVTNDTTKEIGCLFFKDKELDAAEDLTRFLNETCGWKLIRDNGE